MDIDFSKFVITRNDMPSSPPVPDVFAKELVLANNLKGMLVIKILQIESSYIPGPPTPPPEPELPQTPAAAALSPHPSDAVDSTPTRLAAAMSVSLEGLTDKVSEMKDILHRVRDDVKDRGLDAVKDLVMAAATAVDDAMIGGALPAPPPPPPRPPFQLELVVSAGQPHAEPASSSSSSSSSSAGGVRSAPHHRRHALVTMEWRAAARAGTSLDDMLHEDSEARIARYVPNPQSVAFRGVTINLQSKLYEHGDFDDIFSPMSDGGGGKADDPNDTVVDIYLTSPTSRAKASSSTASSSSTAATGSTAASHPTSSRSHSPLPTNSSDAPQLPPTPSDGRATAAASALLRKTRKGRILLRRESLAQSIGLGNALVVSTVSGGDAVKTVVRSAQTVKRVAKLRLSLPHVSPDGEGGVELGGGRTAFVKKGWHQFLHMEGERIATFPEEGDSASESEKTPSTPVAKPLPCVNIEVSFIVAIPTSGGNAGPVPASLYDTVLSSTERDEEDDVGSDEDDDLLEDENEDDDDAAVNAMAVFPSPAQPSPFSLGGDARGGGVGSAVSASKTSLQQDFDEERHLAPPSPTATTINKQLHAEMSSPEVILPPTQASPPDSSAASSPKAASQKAPLLPASATSSPPLPSAAVDPDVLQSGIVDFFAVVTPKVVRSSGGSSSAPNSSTEKSGSFSASDAWALVQRVEANRRARSNGGWLASPKEWDREIVEIYPTPRAATKGAPKPKEVPTKLEWFCFPSLPVLWVGKKAPTAMDFYDETSAILDSARQKSSGDESASKKERSRSRSRSGSIGSGMSPKVESALLSGKDAAALSNLIDFGDGDIGIFSWFVISSNGANYGDKLIKSYGACLRFYVPVEGSASTSFGEDEPSLKLFVPVCLCITTPVPCISTLRKVLVRLHMALKSPTPSSIRQVQRGLRILTQEIPRPIPGVVNVKFDFMGKGGLTIKLSSLMGLPPLPHGGCIASTLAHLGPVGISTLLSAFLLEQKVLLVSEDENFPCMVSEVVVALLHPFAWDFPFIPVLPREMIDMVQAPLPFVIGVRPSWIRDMLGPGGDNLADVFVYDLDHNRPFDEPGCGRAKDTRPQPLPQPLARAIAAASERLKKPPPGLAGTTGTTPVKPRGVAGFAESFTLTEGKAERLFRVECCVAICSMMRICKDVLAHSVGVASRESGGGSAKNLTDGTVAKKSGSGGWDAMIQNLTPTNTSAGGSKRSVFGSSKALSNSGLHADAGYSDSGGVSWLATFTRTQMYQQFLERIDEDEAAFFHDLLDLMEMGDEGSTVKDHTGGGLRVAEAGLAMLQGYDRGVGLIDTSADFTCDDVDDGGGAAVGTGEEDVSGWSWLQPSVSIPTRKRLNSSERDEILISLAAMAAQEAMELDQQRSGKGRFDGRSAAADGAKLDRTKKSSSAKGPMSHHANAVAYWNEHGDVQLGVWDVEELSTKPWKSRMLMGNFHDDDPWMKNKKLYHLSDAK